MLMKDNLIDEEKAKQEEAAQENLIQKIDRFGETRLTCFDMKSSLDWIVLWKVFLQGSRECWQNTPAFK